MPHLTIEQFGLQATRLTPPHPMGRIHHHHEIELNYLFSGEIAYLHHGTTRRLEAGRLAAFWGAVPHTMITATPASDMVWITLPLALVRAWELPPDFMRHLLAGHWIIAHPGHSTRFPIASWAAELHAHPHAATGIAHELHGCLIWLARHSQNDTATQKSDTGGLDTVANIATVIAQNYQEPIDVPAIAAAVGLHPKYAMTLFKKRCGMTIRDYLTQLRLMHAQRMLLQDDTTIAQIAYESGFTSLSAFYELFTHRIGTTPTQFRNRFTRNTP